MSLKGKAIAVGVIAIAAASAHGHGRAAPGDPRGWPAALLRAAHEPVTACDVSFLRVWARTENTAAGHNPLATTMPEPGSTTFNSAGVQNYVSYRQGLRATAATLHNGLYQALVSDLAAGDDAQQCANDVAASKWGTQPFSASC